MTQKRASLKVLACVQVLLRSPPIHHRRKRAHAAVVTLLCGSMFTSLDFCMLHFAVHFCHWCASLCAHVLCMGINATAEIESAQACSSSVQGCTCDSQLLNLLPMVGAQASQIQFGKQSLNYQGPKTIVKYKTS